MSKANKKYLYPTPGGAFYLAQDNAKNWRKDILKYLFSSDVSLELNDKNIFSIFKTNDKENLLYKIEKCQRQGLIQVVDEKIIIPEGHFEQNLNNIIRNFSKKEKVLLSDSQGLCIANYGFPAEMLEEISVLSADIAIMHKRRALNINKKLGLNSQAWSIVDASGNSNLGFWPINIDKEVFVLVIEGVPFFNQPAMVTLVWMLYLRYGK